MWGGYVAKFDDVSNPTRADVLTELIISEQYPAGYVLSEFISLDETVFTDIVQSVFAEHEHGEVDISLLKQLLSIWFPSSDDAPILFGYCGKYELLDIANHIAIFREFINLCNNNPAMFSDMWFEAFAIACQRAITYSDDCHDENEYTAVEVDINTGQILTSWTKEIPLNTSKNNVSNAILDYEDQTPKENASLLLEVMQNEVEYIAEFFAPNTIPGLRYRDPAKYLFESLKNLIDLGVLPKKCKNCGKYFVPEKRYDAIYCDRQAPQDINKTCKKYGAAAQWHDNISKDEAASLYRKIYMAKQIASKRKPDIHAESFDMFKDESKQWKKDVKAGAKTEGEYLTWLKSFRAKDGD